MLLLAPSEIRNIDLCMECIITMERATAPILASASADYGSLGLPYVQSDNTRMVSTYPRYRTLNIELLQFTPTTYILSYLSLSPVRIDTTKNYDRSHTPRHLLM